MKSWGAMNNGDLHNERPLTGLFPADGSPLGIDDYEKAGGYSALKKALQTATADITNEVKASGLRGRGGAGFPTGQKWTFVPMDGPGGKAPSPRYIISNSDEMEPGAFKDRLLMENNPHQIIEGLAIAARAVGAEKGYIFLRREYGEAKDRLGAAVAEAYGRNYLGNNIMGSGFSLDVKLHVSAGRYICGEETALLNAIEGKRAIPRSKPPYPQLTGLWGEPAVVDNVETLSCLPHIISRGADWFKGLSHTGEGGTKIYTVSGRARKPGWWELPMGSTIRELLYDHAGGMQDGYNFRGVIPGGASTDFLLEEHLDTRMDFSSMQKAGSRLGTGTMIILDDRTCPVGVVHNLMQFFARESCGWCTPCREGLSWLRDILRAMENGAGETGDLDILEEHTRLLSPGHTYCALAPGAVEPLQSALKYFRADFEAHIQNKKCPWKA